MPKIVFDIETVGVDFDELDEKAQEYFLKFADSEDKIKEAKESTSFFPLTAQIVAIGMLEVDSERGMIFYQNGPGGKPEKSKEGDIIFVSGTEKEILVNFWHQLKNYSPVITFNGRVFDGPFLMLRSAMNGIRPTKNLVPYRYAHAEHVDLADQLSFYDAMRRKFSLHMWCKAFDIKSPKDDGMTGLLVKDYYKQGKYMDIARYCMGDIRATKELYLYWEKYLKF